MVASPNRVPGIVAPDGAESEPPPPNPELLPPVFPVLVASKVLGIGKNQTYALIKQGMYPVRVLEINGRLKVSKYNLLAYLGAPGYDPSPSAHPSKPQTEPGG